MVASCEQFANDAFTLLTASVAISDLTITVDSVITFPVTTPFRIMINDEIMMVTGILGNVFTVTRGIEETAITTHAIGDEVSQVLTNESLFAWSECRFATGPRASLPTPELDGRLYITQDPGWYLFREDGSTWRTWGPIFQLYEGLNFENSDWNWTNVDDEVNPIAGLTNWFGDLNFSVNPNAIAGENIKLFTQAVNKSTPYQLGENGTAPYDICSGPDGNLWVTDPGGGYIWKVTTAGVATPYAIIGSSHGICSGPDGNLWVTDTTGFVWKVTTAGVATSYALTNAIPYGICSGPDGNLWVTDTTGFVWKVTTAGVATSYALTGSEPQDICTGSDGNLWVADLNEAVWKVTTAGVPTSYTLTGASPQGICSGSDSNLWVADMNEAVWKVTTAGVPTSYTLTGAVPYDIASGTDTNLWVTDLDGFLWKVTTGGVPTQYTLAGTTPYGLTDGPDGNIWIADNSGFVWKAPNAQTVIPYTVTVAFTPLLSPVNQTCCGIVFRDSATEEFIICRIMYDDTSVTKRDLVISLDKYDDPNNFNSNYKTLSAGTLTSPMVWFIMEDDGVDLNWYFSNDGFNFVLFDTQTRTDFLVNGPDEIGIGFGTNNTTGGAGMNLHSWLKV
jgi:virginiamycin B lyase